MDYLELEATRGDPWLVTIDYVYDGSLPLDGSAIRLQWRLYEGAAGDPLYEIDPVSFTDIAATSEDIALGVARAGDRILRMVIEGDAVPTDLPTGINQPEAGEADKYVWDAVILDALGAVILRFVGGDIIVNKGVTVGGA